MTLEAELPGEDERSDALDGWVAAFDDELEQGPGFAVAVAAIAAHGCFDVQAVVERWILANRGEDAAPPSEPSAAPPPEPPRLELVHSLPPAEADVTAATSPAAEPPAARERAHLRPVESSAPDIAYFHSLLSGGIDRTQLDEAFPGFRLVIDEAVEQLAAEAPILSDAPKGPSRADLNDEIRGIRKDLQAARPQGRRRWRSRD